MPPSGDTRRTENDDSAARDRAEKEAMVTVLEAVAGGLITYDVATRTTLVNAAALAIFGLDASSAELSLEARLAVIQPRHADGTLYLADEMPLHRALRGETVREAVVQMRAADGRMLWICTTAAPVRQGGEITGVVQTLRDVTEERHAEDALQASEARFRTLFEKAGEAIVIVAIEGSDAGTILHANAAAAAVYGYTPEEMRGMHSSRVMTPEGLARVPDTMRQLATSWASFERIRVRKDGTRFPIALIAGPLELDGKRCLVSFGHDVSERELHEQQLQCALEAAEAASRAKTTFLANMSHEVRTPMHSVLGYAQVLLRDPQIDGVQRRGIEAIFKSGEHLLALLNDLLDVSRIGSGLFAANRADLDLKLLIDEAVQLHAPRASNRDLTLALEWSLSVPRYVVGDQEKLGRVLANLLSNAIKFTERGGVTILVATRRGEPEGTGERLVIAVRDTGPGIRAEDLELLFHPFAQLRVGIEARGGSGLGLALSRELARLMGGQLVAESMPGEGSTFRLDLPLVRGTGPGAARTSSRGAVTGVKGNSAPRRILVVEDNEDERLLFRLLLGQAGFDVREAADGAAALETFDAWHPHLVLLDMGLPILDGHAVARAIRQRDAGRTTPLVAITAHGGLADRTRMLEAGIDMVLVKPCTADEILEEVRKPLGLEYSYAEQAPGSMPPSQPPEGRTSVVPSVPPSLLGELRDTVRAADYFRMMEIIEQLPSDAASELRGLAERYDYAAIERLLRG